MKLLAVAMVALMGSATVALAENSLGPTQVQRDAHMVTFSAITADADGVVEIYDFQNHQIGKLLGSHPIHAGSNTDVRVDLSDNPQNSAVAVLVVGDEPVAMQHIDFSN